MSEASNRTFAAEQRYRERRLRNTVLNPGFEGVLPDPSMDAFYGSLSDRRDEAHEQGLNYQANMPGGRGRSLGRPGDEEVARSWAINTALSDMQDDRRAREQSLRSMKADADMREAAALESRAPMEDRAAIDRAAALSRSGAGVRPGEITKSVPLSRTPSPVQPETISLKDATARESAFQSWYAGMARQHGLDPNPDSPEQQYDYRAAFKAGAQPDASGHWPSTFKQPGHPNEVVGGFNTRTGERVSGQPQASEAELVRLGWEPATAKRLTQQATPSYQSRAAGPMADPQDVLRAELPGRVVADMDRARAATDIKRQAAALDAAQLAETVRKNKAAEAAGASNALTPEGVDLAARNYLQTGTMPPLGMGDKTSRQRILDRAAEIGGPGASVSANKADYQANAGSLTALQKQRDAISAFEQTAMKNIDVFLSTAGKVVDTGSPMMNMLARQVSGKMLGSPDQAAYDAARQVAVNEIAKITTNPNLSGQLSDAARHEVDSFNPREATLAQSVAVMRLLKTDMGNRITSLDESLKGIRGRLATAPGSKDSGTVEMMAPDGRVLNVPAADVAEALKAGAKRKGGG